MISVTTPTVENGVIVEYKGIVTGQVVNGVNFIKDFGARFATLWAGAAPGMRRSWKAPVRPRWQRWRATLSGWAPMRL